MSIELLSRIQFAFTLTFHYIYPPLSIGLSLALVFMEGMYLKTKHKIWENMTKYWVRIFALTFALGVATGIPLQFSLGTNWAPYSRFIGDVFGSALSAEGFFAFLVEGGFLGVLLFGWDKVKPSIHFLSTLLVAFGAHFSAFWIVSANSWMQYPSAYRVITEPDGTKVAEVTNWWEMLFNPMAIDHIVHVLLGAWLTGAFLIISIASYYLLKKRYPEFSQKSMKVGVFIAFAAGILQLIAADSLAKGIAKHNPTKLAAMEGLFTTQEYATAYAVGWVDTKNKKTYGIGVPGLLSFLVSYNPKTTVQGLDAVSQDEWPWIQAVFQSYHLMILSWILMMIAAILGIYMWWRNVWVLPKFWHWFLVISVGFPQIGNLAGWYSACMGRQPWVVYKLMKTSEGFSANITITDALISLTMFVIMYLLFFVLFLFLLDRKIKHGQNLESDEQVYRNRLRGET